MDPASLEIDGLDAAFLDLLVTYGVDGNDKSNSTSPHIVVAVAGLKDKQTRWREDAPLGHVAET